MNKKPIYFLIGSFMILIIVILFPNNALYQVKMTTETVTSYFEDFEKDIVDWTPVIAPSGTSFTQSSGTIKEGNYAGCQSGGSGNIYRTDRWDTPGLFPNSSTLEGWLYHNQGDYKSLCEINILYQDENNRYFLYFYEDTVGFSTYIDGTLYYIGHGSEGDQQLGHLFNNTWWWFKITVWNNASSSGNDIIQAEVQEDGDLNRILLEPREITVGNLGIGHVALRSRIGNGGICYYDALNYSNGAVYTEDLIFNDSFDDLSEWNQYLSPPGIVSLNTSFGYPAPSVEINSTMLEKNFIRKALKLPDINKSSLIKTSVDFFIPEEQVGTIHVISGSTTSTILFPFQVMITDLTSIKFLIYDRLPDISRVEVTKSFSFNSNLWYKFVINSYNDHFTLSINNTKILTLESNAYMAMSTEIAFGDGSDIFNYKGHYIWDNLKIVKIFYSSSPTSSTTTSSSTTTTTSSSTTTTTSSSTTTTTSSSTTASHTSTNNSDQEITFFSVVGIQLGIILLIIRKIKKRKD